MLELASNISQSSEFINNLDRKYDYEISQSGKNVSGGQKQRLCIARAIAADPDVYIFDDSFSALDYKTDLKLRKELAKVTKNKTIIIVAQRISTIINADQIIVLDNGRVVGIGTHKELLKDKISSIIGSNIFHLEQVYTLKEEKYNNDNDIDIIYLAITNIENVKKLDNNYKLVDFSIKNNVISFDKQTFNFKTKEHIKNNNVEYYHEFNLEDIKLEKKLLEIIIAYKQLRSKIDNSDIIFKFFGKTFSLEDVRNVYEMIKEVNVDKSNFRKKIVKYCKEVDIDNNKKGYRPSRLYTFKVLKGDIWL